ncbi:MAG: tyrosine-protein phosphatase [Proteobacteria bacterium]|nr:tyrosine-protein phosphatase [Pseudomonadota bacterium]HQR05161.1 tyrosine-protein phosphatase [Rhodocyclaceae bacterium]
MTSDTINLEGAPNFRDLGGNRAADGRRVRHGRVYRSESLAHLTADDRTRLARLGVRRAADLRSAYERQHRPSLWPEANPPEILTLDVNVDMRAGHTDLIDLIRKGADAGSAEQIMLHTYRLLPVAFESGLARIFDALLEGEQGYPFVFHCTAGKDRTGFVAAMLLLALGASENEVYRDYLRTLEAGNLERMKQQTAKFVAAQMGRAPDDVLLTALSAVRSEYLDAALDTIRTRHGSVDAYLDHAGGLNDLRRARLRDLLLE